MVNFVYASLFSLANSRLLFWNRAMCSLGTSTIHHIETAFRLLQAMGIEAGTTVAANRCQLLQFCIYAVFAEKG